ncbi:MAG: ribonuclease III domain-containing protein [Flavobacteriales bacterium]
MNKLKGLFGKKNNTFNSQDKLATYLLEEFGVKVRNVNLYIQSVTHKSKSADNNNERLEYLGDTILSSIVAAYLYKKFPEKNEGGLTILTSKIVTRNKLNEIGSFIKLNEHIIAVDFQNGYKNIVGNAFEAVIGAIYLDHGFKKACQAVEKSLLRHINLKELDEEKTNYKSVLVVWGQKTGNKVVFKGKKLPETSKYKSILYINGKKINSTAKPSKKEAEQTNSERALSTLLLKD